MLYEQRMKVELECAFSSQEHRRNVFEQIGDWKEKNSQQPGRR
ncbi:hypothetical protein [Chitinophaga sp.]